MYCLFELVWEYKQIGPCWSRRKVIVIEMFISKYYMQDQPGDSHFSD